MLSTTDMITCCVKFKDRRAKLEFTKLPSKNWAKVEFNKVSFATLPQFYLAGSKFSFTRVLSLLIWWPIVSLHMISAVSYPAMNKHPFRTEWQSFQLKNDTETPVWSRFDLILRFYIRCLKALHGDQFVPFSLICCEPFLGILGADSAFHTFTGIESSSGRVFA